MISCDKRQVIKKKEMSTNLQEKEQKRRSDRDSQRGVNQGTGKARRVSKGLQTWMGGQRAQA